MSVLPLGSGRPGLGWAPGHAHHSPASSQWSPWHTAARPGPEPPRNAAKPLQIGFCHLSPYTQLAAEGFQRHWRRAVPSMSLKCDKHTWRVALNLQIIFSCHTAQCWFFFPGSSRPTEEQFFYKPQHPELPAPATLSVFYSHIPVPQFVPALVLSVEGGRVKTQVRLCGEGCSQVA